MNFFRSCNKRPAALSALLAAAALVAAPLAPARAADDVVISPQIESAVDRGLETLAKTQNADGSWTADGASGAATGLAVMAFMARGHVPGQGRYGDNVSQAIDYLLSIQQGNGLFDAHGRQMYEHGICTIALCEAYGMLDERRQEKARAAVSRAIRVILDAQRIPKSDPADRGGWRYSPAATDSDTSVTGWQLMALRGAKNIGAFLPADAIESGIAYLKRHAVDGGGGGFSYTGRGNVTAALTGTGVLTLILLGDPNAPEVKAGGDYLLRTNLDSSRGGAAHYYYTLYYCSQAAWQLGGQYWTLLSRQINDSLLRRQKADGSWSEGGGTEGGQPYCTAMAILALTVPYRYLPIYQR